MKRIFLNGGGGWFDKDKAQVFGEKEHDKDSLVHEEIFITHNGAHILHKWMDHPAGVRETYVHIHGSEAIDWLARHGHDASLEQESLLAAQEI